MSQEGLRKPSIPYFRITQAVPSLHSKMAEGEVPAHYEDLAQIEEEFDGIETEMSMRNCYLWRKHHSNREQSASNTF